MLAYHGNLSCNALIISLLTSNILQPAVIACVTAEAGAPDIIHAPSIVPFCNMSAASVKVIYSQLISSGKFNPAAVK